MLSAFVANQNFKSSNTKVVNLSALCGEVWVMLFDNVIAKKNIKTEKVRFSLAGWDTPTTRSRLNALGCNVYKHKGVTMRDGKPWIQDRKF